MESNKAVQERVRAFWEDYLNSGDPTKIPSHNFSPKYTFQGQALTQEATVAYMSSVFSQFAAWHFTVLDLFGEQQGNVNKVVVRSLLRAVLKENGAMVEAMATNVVTADDTGVISNWQTGPASIDQMTKVPYFLPLAENS